MNDKVFSSGAVVRLRSGGPSMTVENSSEWDGVPCNSLVWFDATEGIKRMDLKNPRDVLMQIDPPQ